MSDETGVATKRSVTGAWAFSMLGLMTLGFLLAAYMGLRGGRNWPDPDAKLENYSSVLITVTLLMGSVTAEWAARSSQTLRSLLTAFGLTAFFGLAALNAIYYNVDGIGIGAGSSTYAVSLYSTIALSTALIVIATIACLAGVLRSINPQSATATTVRSRSIATIWHAAVIGWLLTYTAVYLVK